MRVMGATDRDLLARIRGEYTEMPGMSLTLDQMVRLSGIERTICQGVLDALVEAKFLTLKPDGRYARGTEEAGPLRLRRAV
jgi:hypothetical protein